MACWTPPHELNRQGVSKTLSSTELYIQ